MTLSSVLDIWKVLDSYFENQPYNLTANQLDSYNTFISHQIPTAIRQLNPINLEQRGGGENSSDLQTKEEEKYVASVLIK